MPTFSPATWLRRLSVPAKFYVIAGLIVGVLLICVLSFAFSLRTMSAIRAYVGGEGLWSKAQKESVNSLLRYSVSHNEEDYQSFLRFLQVPLGDKVARLELDRESPDESIIGKGFLQGGNSPGDLNDMIFLYRDFKNVSYMARAIAIWTAGDAQIQTLLTAGGAVHSDVLNIILAPNTAAYMKLATDLATVQATDVQVTLLENEFSATLGEASRAIGLILLIIFAVLMLVLGGVVLRIALFIGDTIARVDKAKSEFVSLASHQLRTPLTAIAWSAERLLNPAVGELNPKQREYFLRLRQNNHRMTELVNALLNVSRVEIGSFIIDPVESDVQELIADVLSIEKVEAAEKRIVFAEHYPKEPLRIKIDRELFRTVVQIIVTNAVQYSPEASRISVAASMYERGIEIGGEKLREASLVVSIEDHGVGIPKSQQAKIFTKLFRADNVASSFPDGTGLGLYLAKSILESSGGNIWFQSAEYKGTTFYFAIPRSGMRPTVPGKILAQAFHRGTGRLT